jgi:UDP-glucose 4-epimerase
LIQHLVRAGCDVIGWDRKTHAQAHEREVGQPRIWIGELRSSLLDDLFRSEAPDVVVHLGLWLPFSGQVTRRQRYNVTLTHALLDAVGRYRVRSLVFGSHALYYGALPELPLIRLEADPPLGVAAFPEASDVVTADLLACQALWSLPSARVCVLRCCEALAGNADGLLARLWRGPRVPTVLGYDPLVQFLDARDVAFAISLAVLQQLSGVYNVGSARPMPMSQVMSALGRTHVPIPEAVFRISARGFGLAELPGGALSLLKYPLLVDDAAFRNRTGFRPCHDEAATLENYRLSLDQREAPPPPEPPT